jgi:hypothetical protein
VPRGFRLSRLQHALKGLVLDGATAHGRTHVALEALAVGAQVFGGLLVEWVGGVGLEEEELTAGTSR